MNLSMGVPLRVATATSNMMIGITAAASAVIYLIHGGIDPYVAGPTAIGVFIGATAGSRLGHRVNTRMLRLLFVVVLVYTAIEMLFRALGIDRMSATPRDRPRREPQEQRLRRRGAHRPFAHRGDLRCGRAVGDRLLPDDRDGISPMSGGPPLDLETLGAQLVALDPAGFLWLGLMAVIAAPIGRVIVALDRLRPATRTG